MLGQPQLVFYAAVVAFFACFAMLSFLVAYLSSLYVEDGLMSMDESIAKPGAAEQSFQVWKCKFKLKGSTTRLSAKLKISNNW